VGKFSTFAGLLWGIAIGLMIALGLIELAESTGHITLGAKAMSEEKEATAAMVCKLADGTEAWCLHAPPGTSNEQMTKVFEELKLHECPTKWKAIDGWRVDPLIAAPQPEYVNGPHFTWDEQTAPPTRLYDPERDGPYPVAQVHNSQSPGLKKQGRYIRPITKANAELAIWLVDINGEEVTVHDPEEAWQ